MLIASAIKGSPWHKPAAQAIIKDAWGRPNARALAPLLELENLKAALSAFGTCIGHGWTPGRQLPRSAVLALASHVPAASSVSARRHSRAVPLPTNPTANPT